MLQYIQIVLTSLVLQNIRAVVKSLMLLLSLEQKKEGENHYFFHTELLITDTNYYT